jgi:hypothetical protein
LRHHDISSLLKVSFLYGKACFTYSLYSYAYLIRPSTRTASLSPPLSGDINEEKRRKKSFALIADKEIDVPHFPVDLLQDAECESNVRA